MGLAETAELSVRIGLDDKLSPGLAKVNRSLGTFESSTKRIGKGVGEIGRGFARAGLVAGGAVVLGLGAAAKAAIDYQDAFQGVVKTVDEADLTRSGGSFQKLSDSIRKMSREMPNSAIELANIAAAAGALGVKGKDIESFTRQVAILASTTNLSADEAATALGQLQNVIGLTGDEFDNFAASLVQLGNTGASTEADILEIARRSGGAAKLFGIAKKETLGWAAAAANLGLNAELAGTSLQRVFVTLLSKASKGNKELAKVMGLTGKQVKKAFAKDASGALETFIKKLAKMPKSARLAEVQKIFGKGTGITRLILGLAGSIDNNLTPALNQSADAWDKSTAAAAEFEKRNATVKSAFQRLRNNIIDAAVTIGEGFAPALGRAADKLSNFLSLDGNRSKLKALGEDIGKAIDKIDFDRLLRTAQDLVAALKPAAGILLKIAEAIGKLPPELLGAGGAIVVTNKVTGGLVIKGVEDIVGGLGKSLAVGLASNIPLFGKAFVQPVFVTNPSFGGPGNVLDDVGKIGIIATLRESLKGLLKGLGTGAGAGINGFDFEAFRNRAEAPGGPIDRLTGSINRLSGSLTGHGGPGRGGPTPGDQTKQWAANRQAWSTTGTKIDSLHHAAVGAIDGLKTTTKSESSKNQSIAHQGVAAGRMTKAAVDASKASTASKLAAANAKLDAIRHKKTSISIRIPVTTNVSVSDVVRKTTTSTRYNTRSYNQAF